MTDKGERHYSLFLLFFWPCYSLWDVSSQSGIKLSAHKSESNKPKPLNAKGIPKGTHNLRLKWEDHFLNSYHIIDVGLGLRTMGKSENLLKLKSRWGLYYFGWEGPRKLCPSIRCTSTSVYERIYERWAFQHSTQWSKHLQNSVNDAKPNYWDRGH